LTFSEEGEDNSCLPYVRLSRRNHPRTLHGTTGNMSEAEMIESMAIREVSADRLLATKRIINAFNAGDIETIHDIINDCAFDTCEVYFSNLQHVFIGKIALFSLWASLFDAFPNGIFRTSDSVINEKKQVFTSFLFFGTKIFPLLIDGMPLEALATTKPLDPQSLVQTASVKVDRSRPMFTTTELLEVENIPEMVFEGRIVLHLNEQCRIRKFDFAWNRKM
jgi:hypothetical protein